MVAWPSVVYLALMTTALAASFLVARRLGRRRGVVALSVLACAVYLVWRLGVVPIRLGLASAVVGVVLYAAELLGVCSFLVMLFLFTGRPRTRPLPLDALGGRLPTVDVLVCTYNEPVRLLRMTVAAALNLDYPSELLRVHVCDDGSRPEVEALCRAYGVGYVTREGNEGAKAGNVNNALAQVDGELFAVLDADMIPKREFLARTVGLFADERLAFVQTPQAYYNQDMYQYNLRQSVPNEQDFFMREVQQARDARGAVLHVGTNAVFSREKVLSVGGYPTCSITEDMALGELLQAAGYDTAFVNEGLVYGLSATTFPELVRQRERWCRGNLQVLAHYNPLTLPGLTVSQRIAYLDGALYWFSNLQKMVFLVCPLVFFLTGTMVLDVRLDELLCVYLPFVLGQQLAFASLTSGLRGLKWSHYYDVAMAPHLSLAIVRELLGVRVGFRVTSKETTLDRRLFQARIVLPHIALLALTALGWALSALAVAGGAPLEAFLLNYVWSAYNAFGLVNAIRVANQRPIYRRSERLVLGTPLPVGVRATSWGADEPCALLVDVSGEGAAIELADGAPPVAGERVTVRVRGVDVASEVVRARDSRVAVRFLDTGVEAMRAVMGVFQDNVRSPYERDWGAGGSEERPLERARA